MLSKLEEQDPVCTMHLPLVIQLQEPQLLSMKTLGLQELIFTLDLLLTTSIHKHLAHVGHTTK